MKVPLTILTMLTMLAGKVVDIDVEHEGNVVIVYITCSDEDCVNTLSELVGMARESIKGGLTE